MVKVCRRCAWLETRCARMAQRNAGIRQPARAFHRRLGFSQDRQHGIRAMPTAFHYAVTVFAWGFTWTAIHVQVGAAPVAVSIFYRFALAGAALLLAVAVRGVFPRGGARMHFWLAAQGLCLFCINFLFLYEATSLIPSGLV